MVCYGLEGHPDSIGSALPAAKVRTGIICLQRNRFACASKRHWPKIAANLKPDRAAPNVERTVEEFTDKQDRPYLATIRPSHNTRDEFAPFPEYKIEICKGPAFHATERAVDEAGQTIPGDNPAVAQHLG